FLSSMPPPPTPPLFPYTTLFRSWFPIARTRHHADAETAENGTMNTLRMFERQKCCDARAHGVAHDMRFFDPKVIEKRCCIRRHLDRKSTRLNSSHVKISYAVFCL